MTNQLDLSCFFMGVYRYHFDEAFSTLLKEESDLLIQPLGWNTIHHSEICINNHGYSALAAATSSLTDAEARQTLVSAAP
jgi:hypothetical protein